ncbi:uncharacterized protein MYCGRDRAFT_98126 [Zymoseptoria tritici IPO323]|uniref:Uncharacterized protein n=1 Tax=Zymoseptoria tritici (strain CBS 115943 / IPO323) TaxID=336722 RepID=F9XSD6_ZYMTI|nr:uncharacterized protein MYCGRDRAFT_98126 [Zymoseptoria tritici IPO323]EGP81850.1 hypothetical protein MYCGRDRAFT_98126 [Zymoseptoria tritici IPO323]
MFSYRRDQAIEASTCMLGLRYQALRDARDFWTTALSSVASGVHLGSADELAFLDAKVIYFIPEALIPDKFYTSAGQFADFSILAFQKYRIKKDVMHCVGGVVQWRRSCARAVAEDRAGTEKSCSEREESCSDEREALCSDEREELCSDEREESCSDGPAVRKKTCGLWKERRSEK